MSKPHILDDPRERAVLERSESTRGHLMLDAIDFPVAEIGLPFSTHLPPCSHGTSAHALSNNNPHSRVTIAPCAQHNMDRVTFIFHGRSAEWKDGYKMGFHEGDNPGIYDVGGLNPTRGRTPEFIQG